MVLRSFIIWIFLLSGLFLQAQDSIKQVVLPKVFMPEDFLWYIENHHPVALQSRLLSEMGEAEIRKARGNFDPYAYTKLSEKQFDDKQYFNLLDGGLKVPTWYGIEVKGGYERSEGYYINPENTLPNDGLWFAGVTVPIGKGLFIDKRRAVLKQAKIYAESTEAERQRIMNNLFWEGLYAYWNWVEAWNRVSIYQNYLELTEDRLQGVKQRFIQGDIPAIDTLETALQVQNRKIDLNKAKIEYRNTTLDLSNYLWFENFTPLEITEDLVPPFFDQLSFPNPMKEDTLISILNNIESIHPEIQLYDYKLETLEIDRRVKTEALKPKINLNYNLLGASSASNMPSFNSQNYKWGLEFGFPIFLRKERGDLSLAKLKIENTEYSRRQKTLEVRNKILGYHNQLNIMEEQMDLYHSAVGNYEALLSAERRKFSIGESSVFLVNSRETSLIGAQLKFLEVQKKYMQIWETLKWAIGVNSTQTGGN